MESHWRESRWLRNWSARSNTYNNEFWNETALFKTDRGNAFRVSINWRGAFGGCERAQWYGSRMSLFEPDPNGVGPFIRRSTHKFVKDGAVYDVQQATFEPYPCTEVGRGTPPGADARRRRT